MTDFSGLNVLKMTEFRRRLRAAGRQVRRGEEHAGAARAGRQQDRRARRRTSPAPPAWCSPATDPLAAAKVVGDFAKEHEKPTVRAGLVDGKAVAPAYVKRLGELPSRDVLLAQFAGSFNGVLYQLVGALEALREQRQQAGLSRTEKA